MSPVPGGRGTPQEGAAARPGLHWAARVEDAVHGLRERFGRWRGLVPTIVTYPGYGGDGWMRVLARVVLQRPARLAVDRARAVRGWRSFLSIPVRGVEVVVSAGGIERTIRSDRGGVVDGRVELSLPPGWGKVELRLPEGDRVEEPVFVVAPEVRFGIVSDVDDTVMVTALPRPLLAAWNTFVLDEHARIPVPGMAVLYERLSSAHPGSPVVYLSTGAWNVAPTLSRFLHRNLYPRGAMLLTDWGPTHDRWFRSGTAHKRENLRRLAEEFPLVNWLLVGDDGQHDEQLYGEFERERPDRVTAVAIRQLTAGEAVLAGGRSTAERHAEGAPWFYAPDGAGLETQLRAAGLLP